MLRKNYNAKVTIRLEDEEKLLLNNLATKFRTNTSTLLRDMIHKSKNDYIQKSSLII